MEKFDHEMQNYLSLVCGGKIIQNELKQLMATEVYSTMYEYIMQ